MRTCFIGILTIIMLVMASLPVLHHCGDSAHAAVAGPVRQGVESIVRIFSSSGRTAASELSEFGGEAAVRRVADRAFREGGEEAVEGIVRMAGSHGVYALRAADNAVNIPAVIRAVDELPSEMAGPALRRLSGSEGRALSNMVQNYGSSALRSEVMHPGIGMRAISTLGQDGADLMVRMSSDQAVTLGRHLDDIARLPATQRQDIAELIYRDMERMIQFIGDFIRNNPGKVLFTASATTIILKNSDKVLDGGEIIYDEEGKPHLIEKPGFIERIIKPVVDPVMKVVVWVMAPVIGLCAGIRLWFYYRRKRKEHEEWLQHKDRQDETEDNHLKETQA